MRNYIMLFNFTDNQAQKKFQHSLQEKYPHFKIDCFNGVNYYGFPAKHVPGVEDNIHETLQQLSLNDRDYVALYFKRHKNDEELKQDMILGNVKLLENDLQHLGWDQHLQNLNNLIEDDLDPQ